MYLLDTNACIRILNNTSVPLIKRLRRRSPGEIHLCSVVKAELIHGAYRSARIAENLRLLQRFFEPFSLVTPLTTVVRSSTGVSATSCSVEGTPIGPNDLMIASIAVVNNLILITNNTREFERVVGLRLEDWERE